MLPYLCYTISMKRDTYNIAIEMLKNKKDYTYKEISKITGYHQKSLIRLNSLLKKGSLKENNKEKIKDEITRQYMNTNCSSYKEFYRDYLSYDISYSTLCKILSTTNLNKDFILIKKIKEKGHYYFKVIDYKSKTLILTFDSLKNDKNSIKEILYLIFSKYGLPKEVCFNNFFKTIPLDIKKILRKYNITIIPFKSVYRITNINNSKEIRYSKATIDKKDFYKVILRKTIDTNMIQFNNTRYTIDANLIIPKNKEIKLYFNQDMKDLFITYQDKEFKLKRYKDIQSKKENSKYY